MIKTFTKQNFKTNPLWIRLLFMTFMLLLGTSSAWGATIPGGMKLYLKPNTNWQESNANFYLYVYTGSTKANVKMSKVNDANSVVYEATVPTGSWSNLIFVRTDPSNSNPLADNWPGKWNQTGDLTWGGTHNCCSINSGQWDCGNNVTWSTYTPPCTPPTLTLATTSATVNKGDEVNLTTLSGATASNSGTIEWSTSTTGSPVIDENVTVSATKTYYAKAVKDGCKSASQSFKITAACTKDFYLVGSSTTIFGGEWSPAQAANKMDCNSNSLTKTYTNITVAANTKVEYKITGESGWSDAEYPSSGNASFTIPTAGTYNITFTANTNGTSITGTPTVTWELSCNNVAKPTITLDSSPVKCGVNVTAGSITIDGYDDSKYTYTLYKDGNATTIAYGDDGYAITEAGSYTVTADVSENSCGAQTSEPQAVTVTDNTHTINDFTVTPASDNVCKGSSVTLTATDVNGANYAWYKGTSETPINGATSYTYSPTITENTTFKVVVTKTNNGCPATADATSTIQVIELPAAPTLNSNSTTVCGGEPFELQNIDGVTWSLDDETTTINQSGIANNTDEAIIKTFKAVKEVDGCPSAPADYKVTVYPTPVITGESVAQPGKTNAINLKLQGNLVADWSVNPTADLSYTTNSNSTDFSAETNDTYTITATTKEGCFATHSVTVKDASYVYVRRPRSGDGTNVYTNWYINSNVEGGPLYIKRESITAGNASANNQGGNLMTEAFTDCNGFVWDKYEIAAGQTQFYVHAANEKAKTGYATFSQTATITDDQDYYFTLSSWTTSQYGVTITETSDPRKPTVHALGSTTLGTDEFAALYVTDCSGKEITGYQWYKDGQPYSSVCSYVGKKGSEDSNAGETNNIRPTVAGYYSCTVTYADGTTATSAAVEIDGSYSRSFTSTIPVLVVNTGGKGFPDCTGLSGQTASKNASTFKEKRSVDVKIYEGGTLVYDRKARMNYRGSSSLNFVKKSYAFCPGDANCGDADKGADYVKTAKLNMLGVGTACDKDWVLYAAAADPSLMRNRLVFDSYKTMTGKWGVNSRYVELIVDGEYKGVYVFMDKITMNKDRVKVDEDKGFIVKFDKTDKEDRVGGYNGILGDEKTFKTSHTGKDDIGTYDTSIDQRFEIEYPEKDDYTTGWKARVDGIQGMFQAFEDALEQGDYATVQKYIDYTSWADWFIINEFTKNVDAYRASCIFVYTGEAGAKIEARPLWDQELSFNNTATTVGNGKGCSSTSGLLIQNAGVYSDGFPAPFWFTGGSSDITGGLLSDPCFVQVVKERWNMHQFGALSMKSLEDLVDEYEDDLAPEGTTDNAQTRETAFWNGKSRGTCDCSYNTSDPTATGYQNITFEESKGTITNWISDAAADGATGRRAGLTTALNNLTGASFSIQIIPSEATTTPWEPVEIAVSVTPAGYDYKFEYTDNDLGSVANTIIEEEGDKITYRIPRPDDWGTGDELVEGERTDIEYGIKATLNVQDGTTVCGSQAAPSSTAKIILQDEDNDNCE